MPSIHEEYGLMREKLIQTEDALRAEQENHATTIELLHLIKNGEIALNRVTITGNSWTMAEEPNTAKERAAHDMSVTILNDVCRGALSPDSVKIVDGRPVLVDPVQNLNGAQAPN